MPDWPVLKQHGLRFGQLVLDQLKQHDCLKSASSLTYVTLFALVPLMTVTYSMFTAIPAFRNVGEQMQEMVFAHMVPETGEEVLGYVREFTEQARRLTVVGVVFLVGSAYLMLSNIEKNFNSIWGGLRGRSGISKFLLYWAVLTLGPLLLGAGLAMSTYLMSFRLFVDEYEALGWLTWLFGLTPVVLTTLGFTLLFTAVPNCKVPFRHALIGGVSTALTFEVLKVVFGLIVTHSAITNIYGAFAIVPLFLLWLNISWLTVLIGGILVHTIGMYQVSIRARGYPDLVAALLILWHFHERAAKGDEMRGQEILELGLSTAQWQRLVETLQRKHIIAATSHGNFVLCRDLHKFTLNQLATTIGMPLLGLRLPEELAQVPWYESFAQRFGRIGDFTREQLDITLAEAFDVLSRENDAQQEAHA
ncbi:YihY family inner membrane protein [Marinimicrobium sp. ABcell2]|uniref:YihY family inner membrane protein n=1 Tax=Marinimicrobium sp. ABcell2 TaxID=3069751 RepID=UPI0027B19A60|nr:YihY family inner membrane protein [Marinimicrobium sp. ABcell2]MDQ2075269.1 YihY family inner membrane protein [Marinimicrobium sp. ABcell2]